jgi:hypothetical protein
MRQADLELELPVGADLDRVRALRVQGQCEQHPREWGEHGQHNPEVVSRPDLTSHRGGRPKEP